MMRKRVRTFKPRLEALEDRLCMAAPGGGPVSNPAFAYIVPNKTAGANLYVAQSDASPTFRLTNDNFLEDSPAWSPDGTQIAFLRHPDATKDRANLYTIRPDGTGLRLVHDFGNPSNQPYPLDDNGGGETTLAWSPDSSQIVFTSNAAEDLFVVNVSTGVVQPLLSDLFDFTNDPEFSPDLDPLTPGFQGKIAFSANSYRQGPVNLQSRDILLLDVTIDSNGVIQPGAITNLTDAPGVQQYTAWSPDGRSLAYVDDSGTFDLRVMDLSTRESRLLVANVGNAEATWSPNSDFVAFHKRTVSGGQSNGDLFRIRPDGSGLTNITNTSRTSEQSPDWSPVWVNDLGAALQAAATGSGATAEDVTLSQIDPLFTEAVARWVAAGVDTSGVGSIQVEIADLGGATLGLASGNTIWLDDNAAGWGWFVDATPGDDSEFTTSGDQGELNRMNLLTVVMHELGHVLGYDHDADGVMAESLTAGVRRTDVEHDHGDMVDQVFGQTNDHRPDARLGFWLTEQLESTRPGGKQRR